VEDGLFEARFERSNASERARLVRQRAAQIDRRIAELREERADLLGGKNVTVRERAEAARLAEQSESLNDSISQTETVAQRANVSLNRTALDELRTEARNLTGPEVAELARGLVDRDEEPPRGPPDDRGADRDRGPDREDGVGVENVTDAVDETAVPDGDDPGRSGDAGPPSENDDRSDRPAADERDPRGDARDDPAASDRSDASDSDTETTDSTATPTATATEDGVDDTETASTE
jgi:hypothetical protein